MKHNVAVYGTLKKGHGNHSVLGKDAELLGTQVINGFDMYSLGGFPGVVQGGGDIHIEVYSVTDESFDDVDLLEGYNETRPDHGLYDRVSVLTDYGHAWLYIYNGDVERLPEVAGGEWL